ncbi:MAG: DNA polymerase-2 [Psychroserpens sp.]|jgi:DNA polymerase-2
MQLSIDKIPELAQLPDATSGFLLTRSASDRNNYIEITLWLKTPQGAVQLIIDNERAVFFVEVSDVNHAKSVLVKQGIAVDEIKPVALKAFNQAAVAAVYFLTLRGFYQAREALKQQGIKCYEDDIRPDDRFLMERFITADITFGGQEINLNLADNKHYRRYEQTKCKRIDKAQQTDIELSTVSLDIECSMSGELYSIGLYSEHCQQVLMIANDQEIAREQLTPSDIDIIWQADERQLLVSLLAWFTQHDPDIIIGWNVINFDFDLLQKRYNLHGFKFAIGRDGKAPYWRKNQASDQQFIEINGRVVLDGIDLLKTATYNFPSFSLDNVANTLLGIGKKVDDVDNRLQEITDNFHHNKTALAIYNLEDCRLVQLIFKHTQLLEFAMLRAQLTGLSIDRFGGSVAAFTNLYLPKLHRSGYVAPNMGDGDQGFESPGGFVMDSTPGLYQNVLVLDFKSLYPSIIRSFNIDPMGLIEGLKSPEKAIEGFDGAYFSREKHFLPSIITELWKERDIAKKNKNAALSQAIKIIMNSFYGVLGSTGCRFFDPRLSGSITKRSHSILKTTKIWIEAKGYQVIYGDTDSIFVHVGDDQSAENSKALGKTLQDYINQKWKKSLKEQFNIVSELDIEFETHFSKFLMPTLRGLNVIKGLKSIGTKKRYAGVVNEKLVFKGLETVRSDWTELSKGFQQELYRLIFNEQPVEKYINRIVNELQQGVHDNKLIFKKKIRRKLSDYVNTPPHIKAALIANEKLKKKGIEAKYEHRKTIQYVVTLDGVQPLEFNDSKFDYDFYVEKQLKPIANDILPFIDKDFDSITSNQMGLF